MGGRIVVVDDSSFSVALIRGILEDGGFDVVGEAGNLEEAVAVVKATKPELVTMDMTLPGANGFECSKALHIIDPKMKIIMISSLMDEQLIKEAYLNRILEYVQKPVDPEELLSVVNKVLGAETLFRTLNEIYFPIFKENFINSFQKMTKTNITRIQEGYGEEEFVSRGITVIVSIIGKFSGRVLLDMDDDTAVKFTTSLQKREPSNHKEIMAAIGEFGNIITGTACSYLNRMEHSYGLRIAPPSIIHGDRVHISASNCKTATGIADTEFGKILINIGFERGEK